MVKSYMKQPPNEERCWACLGRDIGQVVGGGVLYLTTPKWFCLRRDIGLAVDGEVFYLTASTWGGVLGLSGKGHWTSSGRCGGDNCFIEVEMGIMPHLGWKG